MHQSKRRIACNFAGMHLQLRRRKDLADGFRALPTRKCFGNRRNKLCRNTQKGVRERMCQEIWVKTAKCMMSNLVEPFLNRGVQEGQNHKNDTKCKKRSKKTRRAISCLYAS